MKPSHYISSPIAFVCVCCFFHVIPRDYRIAAICEHSGEFREFPLQRTQKKQIEKRTIKMRKIHESLSILNNHNAFLCIVLEFFRFVYALSTDTDWMLHANRKTKSSKQHTPRPWNTQDVGNWIFHKSKQGEWWKNLYLW